MKQLFIFDEASRAAVYGIGSYIRECIHCLKDSCQVNTVLYYSSKEVFTVVEKHTHREIHIPRHQLNFTEGKSDERFFINSVYLLHDYIDPQAELIFHFNYFRYPSVIDLLKEYWPQSKMIMTIHYLFWCFTIEGNTSYFKEIIRKEKKDIISPVEREVYSIYQSEKEFLQKMDHVICLSGYTREILENDYQISTSKISLCYNGLKDDYTALSPEERVSLKQYLGLPLGSPVLLFVGRLEFIKGLEYLIRAFKELLSFRKDCILVIAGDGEYANYLKECEGMRSNIIFTGRLPQDQLYCYYQVTDLGVMPSKHEQCSYVAIEMMMHGIPLIASDSTGLNEMVVDGVNGYKLNTIPEKEKVSFDIPHCSRLIQRMLQSDAKEMKKQARKRYEQYYTLTQMREGLLRAFGLL